MPHSGGGGSHSGGSHSSSHSSSSHHYSSSHGSSSGSSRRTSSTPFPGAKRFLYYKDRTPHFIYANYDIRKRNVLSIVMGIVIFSMFSIPAVLALIYGISQSVNVPKKLTYFEDRDKSPQYVIEDELGVIEDKKELKKSIKAFYETTGVVPAVITVENSAWQDDYASMEQYAYDLYVNTFHHDEVYLLIVYSSEAKDNGFDDWHYELMIGDDTEHIFTDKRTDDFNRTLHKRLLERSSYSVDEAIAETLDEYRPKVMKPSFDGITMAVWLVVFFVFSFIGVPFLVIGLKPEKIPPEYKAAQPCNLNVVYQEACNYCGGVYIIGMHTSCPYCGAPVTPHDFVRDANGNVVQIIK